MTAIPILQSYLDRMAKAVLEQDWDTYRQGIDLPFQLTTDTAILTVRSEDELYEGFIAYSDMLSSLEVVALRRVVLAADMRDHDYLTGTYLTNMFSESGRHVFPENFSSIDLLWSGSDFVATAIMNNMQVSRWPVIPCPVQAA